MNSDICIIGGGILGMATAWELLQRKPGNKIVILEQEKQLASHQTGRNSGVIHAGIYYPPGSKKATFCRAGNQATRTFCQQYGIACKNTGKLVVATTSEEEQRLKQLYVRAQQNHLKRRWVSQSELTTMEPAIKGISAIHVPDSSIVNYAEIVQKLAEMLKQAGASIITGERVTQLREFPRQVAITTTATELHTNNLVACAGIEADSLCNMLGINPGFRMLPFRGEYFSLKSQYQNLIQHLVYPVPNPNLPFLGVHLTPMIDGNITIGPNAVLAGSKYAYSKWGVTLSGLLHSLGYPGLYKLLARHPKAVWSELCSSISKKYYLKLVNKYCPQLTCQDLRPWPAGIRAQAVSTDGKLIDDFLFARSRRSLIVCNAPSPAATSAFPIANYIANQLD